MFKKKSLIVVAIIFVSFFLGYFVYSKNLNKPASDSAEKVVFEIKQGDGVKQIVKTLEDKNLVKYPTTFLVYLKLNGLGSSIKAGTYSLNTNMSILDIAEVFTEGKVSTSKLTIPEGWGKEEIANALNKKGIQEKAAILEAFNKDYDYDFLKDKPKGLSLEGYLFPDTYIFPTNPSSETVVKTMLDNFNLKLDSNLRKEISKKGKNIHEILTLASIIEKEVPNDEDRALVAGVFYQRMEIDMALEADSTVNYATKKSSPSVSAEDLKTDSPYNTYKNKGLPPGPICNPSLSAIKAAIYPKESPYLYYLNRQDTRETIFSKTLDEHLENQSKYLE